MRESAFGIPGWASVSRGTDRGGHGENARHRFAGDRDAASCDAVESTAHHGHSADRGASHLYPADYSHLVGSGDAARGYSCDASGSARARNIPAALNGIIRIVAAAKETEILKNCPGILNPALPAYLVINPD